MIFLLSEIHGFSLIAVPLYPVWPRQVHISHPSLSLPHVSHLLGKNHNGFDVLCEESLFILKCVANLIYARYGWHVSIETEDEDPETHIKLPLTRQVVVKYPCDIYIR